MKEKLSDIRLSTRIVISAIAIVMACGFTLILIENTRLRDTYLAEQRTRLEGRFHAEKLQLTHITNELRNDVLFLSNTPPVSGIMRAALNRGHDPRYSYGSKVWEERLQQIFSAYSATHPEYYQIRYIGIANNGRELVRIDNRKGNIEITEGSGLQAKGDRDYFKAALRLRDGEVYLSEFNLNREHGAIEKPYRPTLRAATPVFAPSGQMFGMIVINVDATRLLESITRDVPSGAMAYVANMKGEYLLHPDTALSFGFELGSKGNITEDFPSIKKIFDRRESEHFPLRAVETKPGAQYLAAERVHFDSGNPERFLLLAYLIPEVELARQIATIPVRHITGGLAAMLLIGVIAWFVLRRTFAPLEQLAQAAGNIANGKHDVQLPRSSSREIARLAHAFSTMLDKLSQHELEIIKANQQLEKRVEERTTELQQAKQEIEVALALHKAVTATAIDGFWITDAKGFLLEANEAYAKMSGYSISELNGMHISQLEAREGEPEIAAHIAAIVRQGHDRFETCHRHKDGHEIAVEVSVTYMAASRQFSVFCRDITQRKRSEEALRVAAAAFETQDVIVITDAAGLITRVNNALSAITGYNPDEVLGKSLAMIFQGYSLQDNQQQSQSGDDIYAGELFARRKNGEVYPVWLTITAVKNELHETTHHVVIFSDITARKLAEEERRRESEERFRGTLEQAAVGIAHATLDGYFQHVNQKFCDITGYERGELLHMNFRDITFPADLDENNRCLQQLLLGEIPAFSLEKRFIRKNKNLIWVNLTVSALCDAIGAPKYTIAVIEDITERKQSEAFLQQFGGLLENSFNEIYVLDTDKHRFLLTSEGAESNLGYLPEELYQLTLGDICPSLAGDNLVQVAALLESGMQKSLSMDAVFRRKNGTSYPVELRMQYMKSEFPVFMIVAQDVAERKRAEMALKASAKRHQMLFESSRDALMLLAPPLWQFTAANQATLQMFGVSSEAEFSTLAPWNVSPKWQPDGRLSKEKALEMITIAMREGSHFFQWEHQKIGGQVFTADVLLTRIEAEEEEEEFLLASVRDVTERNRWQQQLRDLTGHIQTVREEEKASIAREIHDHLGSTLTALKMDIYWLTEELQANKEKPHLLGHIGSMSQLLDNAVDVTRRVITDLRPTMLDDLGLHAALEWQAGQFQKRTGIQCRVVHICHEKCKSNLDKTQAINLFRIAQESLTNIARHSGATEAEIELMCEGGEIILTISDNGRGIPEGHVFSLTSYGMLGMRERAGQMGGRVSFYCPPEGGFSVTVIMPLHNARQGEVRV